jgi:hypothetical protein
LRIISPAVQAFSVLQNKTLAQQRKRIFSPAAQTPVSSSEQNTYATGGAYLSLPFTCLPALLNKTLVQQRRKYLALLYIHCQVYCINHLHNRG